MLRAGAPGTRLGQVPASMHLSFHLSEADNGNAVLTHLRIQGYQLIVILTHKGR